MLPHQSPCWLGHVVGAKKSEKFRRSGLFVRHFEEEAEGNKVAAVLSMAELRDQGIDPACHANAQWFGDAPSPEDFLIHLSKRIVVLMNERDTTSPIWNILGPEIRHKLEDKFTTGPVDFLYGYQAIVESNPELRAEVFNSSATVDNKSGRGAVILNINLTGYWCKAQKAGVVLANWRKHEGKWRCVSCFMVFGCPVPA